MNYIQNLFDINLINAFAPEEETFRDYLSLMVILEQLVVNKRLQEDVYLDMISCVAYCIISINENSIGSNCFPYVVSKLSDMIPMYVSDEKYFTAHNIQSLIIDLGEWYSSSISTEKFRL